MNKKIAIVLKNKNGEYSFSNVTEVLNDSNLIEVTNADYNDLVDGKSVSIKAEGIDTEKDIQLVFSQKALYEAAKKLGMDDIKAMKMVKSTLDAIGSGITAIDIKEAGSMISLDITMGKMNEIRAEDEKKEEDEKKFEIDISKIDPDETIAAIKEKVIAQDDTVSTVVRNIYNNQLILEHGDEDIIGSQKTSILLDGPTGTGKTLIMKEVAKQMNLPIVIKPATMYATTGYRGVELQDMLVSLLKVTNGNLEAAERGIVVLDEFDKLGKSGDSDSSLEIRKAVQQDLLTYIGGSKFTVEYKGKSYDFDTSKLTFICLGAFTDMREKKEEHLDANGNYEVAEEDYINAGIMRELVGRFQLITSTRSLSKEDFIRILKESTISPLNKLVELGKNIYNANVVFDEEIIDQIADMALEKNTGARSLNSVVNSLRNLILEDLDASRKTPELTEIRITPQMLEDIKKQNIRRGNVARRAA